MITRSYYKLQNKVYCISLSDSEETMVATGSSKELHPGLELPIVIKLTPHALLQCSSSIPVSLIESSVVGDGFLDAPTSKRTAALPQQQALEMWCAGACSPHAGLAGILREVAGFLRPIPLGPTSEMRSPAETCSHIFAGAGLAGWQAHLRVLASAVRFSWLQVPSTVATAN